MSLFPSFSGGGIGSSANQTTNTTDNKNNATSGSGSAIFDSRGGAIAITDSGIAKNAFDFAGSALNTAADSFAKAANITTAAQATQTQAARESLQSVVDLSTAQSKAGVQSLTENVLKWGVLGLGIVAAALVASNYWKKAA